MGETQEAKPPPSSEHSKVEFDSVAKNSKLASPEFISDGGYEVISVSGGKPVVLFIKTFTFAVSPIECGVTISGLPASSKLPTANTPLAGSLEKITAFLNNPVPSPKKVKSLPYPWPLITT